MKLTARENRLRAFNRKNAHLLAALFSLALTSCFPHEAKAEPAKEENKTFAARSIQQSLSQGAQEGFALSFDSFCLEASANGNAKHRLTADNGSLCFRLGDMLSLHSLDLNLALPLAYNEVRRELDLSLIDDVVYFAVSNLDDPSAYSFAYKANIASYDSPLAGLSQDPLTGGIYQYEFGDLDYLIDDILGILTDGASLATPNLEGGASIDLNEVLQSFEGIEQTQRNSAPYFIWNLPLGEKTLPIGFASDGSYALKGVDLPAKEANLSQSSFQIKSGLSISFSAKIDPLAPEHSFSAPENADDYAPILNSTALFEKIARYAKSKRFSLKAYRDSSLSEEGLFLSHHEDAYVSETSKNYPAVDESIVAKLSANVDFSSGSFDSVAAGIDLVGGGSEQYLDLHILGGDGYNGYLDVNGILKANTTKAVLDGLIASGKDFANDPLIANDTLNGFFGSFSTGGSLLDDILGSDALSEAINDGTYSRIISSISRLEGGADILIEVNTASFGLSGSLSILLEGQLNHLAAISFTDFVFGGFGVSGTLMIDEYEEDDFDPSDYKSMDHLPGITEQMNDLFGSKSAAFSLNGYILQASKNDAEPDTTYQIDGQSINQEGFTFSGSGYFNLAEKIGGGTATFVDRKPDYTNDHHVSIFVEGPETEQEKEDTSEDWTASLTGAVNNMLFSYDSKNDANTNVDGKHPRTDPKSNQGLMGRFSIHSLDGIFDVLSELMGSTDERITSLLDGTSGTSLLSKLQNREIAPLLTNGILVDASLGANKDHFEISKTLLGTAENLKIDLSFASADGGLSRIEVSTAMASADGSVSTLIYLNIGIDDLKGAVSKASIAAADPRIASLLESRNASSTYDFSSLKSLIEYLSGTLFLGQDARGYNSYHLNGTVTLSLGNITIDLDAWIAVKGRSLKIFGNISLPIIATGINSPLSLHLIGGHRYTSFYYHNSGNEEATGGHVYIRRVDIYSDSLSALTHQVKMTGNEFKNDMVGWIVEYMLGIRSSLLNIGTTDSEGQSIHFEDVLNGFTYSKLSESLRWDFKLNVGELAHTNMLGILDAYILGREVNANAGREKTLTKLYGTLGLNILSSEGKEEASDSLITATIDLGLANVSTGSYQDCWNDQANQYYITSKKILFVTTYTLHTETGTVSSFYDNRFYDSETLAYNAGEYYGSAIQTGDAQNYY